DARRKQHAARRCGLRGRHVPRHHSGARSGHRTGQPPAEAGAGWVQAAGHPGHDHRGREDQAHRPAAGVPRAVKRTLLLVFLASLGVTALAAAQSGTDLMRQAVRAYQDLDLDVAAGLIRRAIAFEGPAALKRPERATAFMYLTTVELLRSRPDSARSAARRLVLVDPRYRPDALTFPPQAIALFTGVRRATPAVTARAAADTQFRPGGEALAVRLYASAYHAIRARVTREDGRGLRALYVGPIGD